MNGDSNMPVHSREKRDKRVPKIVKKQFKFPGRSRGTRPTNTEDSVEQEQTAPSLLDEILALGGTKEDLELIEDIGSEEDIVGESQTAIVKGSGDRTVFHILFDLTWQLQHELQKQLKSLGLTGRFPEDSSEDDSESGWTDETPVAKPKEKQVHQKVDPTEPRTIDRPVQLSAPQNPGTKVQVAQKHNKLKLEPHALWYAIERPPISSSTITPTPEIISHHHARGKFLLQQESDNYLSSSFITSSDRQFLSTIMTSGTQTDKLSALTLSITSSPLHCSKQLDALLSMAKKKSRNEAVQSVAAIKDLLAGNLLPDRKLVYFGKQRGLKSNVKDEELILWTFEDWLKGWYFQILQIIEVPTLAFIFHER